MTESDAEAESEDSTTEKRVRRRTLTREEIDKLDEDARPGAVYRESGWRKKAREGIDRIRSAVDDLDRPGGPRRRLRTSSGDLPSGLRSTLTDALGPVAYVQRAYSTKRHHVCHVGVRGEDGVEDAIVLVGPDSVQRFDDVAQAVDALDVDLSQVAEAAPEQAPETLGDEVDPREDPFGAVYPVEAVEGIGETYRKRLQDQGISNTRELWHADARELSDVAEAPATVVAEWQLRAELMAVNGIGPQYAELLVRSGVRGLQQLRDHEPDTLVERIEDKQRELMVRIQGNVIKEARASLWIEAAREHDPDEAILRE